MARVLRPMALERGHLGEDTEARELRRGHCGEVLRRGHWGESILYDS